MSTLKSITFHETKVLIYIFVISKRCFFRDFFQIINIIEDLKERRLFTVKKIFIFTKIIRGFDFFFIIFPIMLASFF